LHTPAHTSDGTRLVRDAFLLEHPDVAAKRLELPALCRTVDGKETCDPVLEDAELAEVDPEVFDPAVVTRILVFHALAGNWDFAVDRRSGAARGGLWNTDVLVLAPTESGERPLAPLPQDFDLASMVTGAVRTRGIPETLLPGRAPLVRQAAHFLTVYLEGRAAAEVRAAREIFAAKRGDLYATLDAAPLDDEGRANATAHLDAFFTALDEVAPP
jgi:hypothetical protein